MKLVIQTQYRENYAAHNEDYVHGVSDPYWKNKGGDTFVVSCSTVDYAMDPGFTESALDAVSYSHESAEEFVINYTLIDDVDFNISEHIEEWETATFLWFDGDHFMATKKTDNTDMGYMRKEILTKFESWTITPEDRLSDYKSTFLMEDGVTVSYNGLAKWFEDQKEVA